jgi:hypothetical protein
VPEWFETQELEKERAPEGARFVFDAAAAERTSLTVNLLKSSYAEIIVIRTGTFNLPLSEMINCLIDH